MEDGDSELDKAPVGALLRYYRGDMTQRALADAAGLSDGLIGNVERGTRNLGIESVHAIADALNLDDRDRERLLAARKRYATASAAARLPTEHPGVLAQILEGQREITEALRDLRDAILDQNEAGR